GRGSLGEEERARVISDDQDTVVRRRPDQPDAQLPSRCDRVCPRDGADYAARTRLSGRGLARLSEARPTWTHPHRHRHADRPRCYRILESTTDRIRVATRSAYLPVEYPAHFPRKARSL